MLSLFKLNLEGAFLYAARVINFVPLKFCHVELVEML